MRSRPLLPVLLLALLLLSLAAGCSAYREVPAGRWGEVGPPGEPSRGAKTPLAPGDRVLLRLRDGCAFQGRLAQAGTDSLIVIVARELPRADSEFGAAAERAPCRQLADGDSVTVAMADLATVERLEDRSIGSFLMGAVGISLSLTILAFWALSHMNWGSN